MDRTILISFRSSSERSKVRASLKACVPKDTDLHIRESDDPTRALEELQTKELSCALIEQLDEPIDPIAAGKIETPIIFVSEGEIPEADLAGFPHATIPKSQLTDAWLRAYLPVLFERARMLIELRDLSQPFERKDLDKEIAGLMSWYYRTTATATAMGLGSARECAPEKFQEMVDAYGKLMDLALEEKTFRVPKTSSTALHNLAQQLGMLNAGPRDVIELYATSLKQKVSSATNARSKALAGSGQVLALELMGYLVSYYRNLARLALQRVVEPAEEHRKDQ